MQTLDMSKSYLGTLIYLLPQIHTHDKRAKLSEVYSDILPRRKLTVACYPGRSGNFPINIHRTVLKLAQLCERRILMPKTITFTTKDVCEALGVAKHHLRNWTDKLEPFSNADTKERSARRFSLGDLSYLAVVDYLEVHYGVSINKIAILERQLYDLINSPSSSKAGYSNFVFICFHSQSCKWLKSKQSVSEGLIIDTNNAHKKINDYLGISPQQVEMQLGLAMVS